MIKKTFKNYLSLVKFSHTIFAMPFAFIGFFLAIEKEEYNFEWLLFILVLLCMVFARNAAMAFNRYTDRNIDKINPRTAQREIPKGIIKPNSAILFTLLNGLLFIGTTYFINNLVFYLSPIALIIILGYSYTKRFTALSHLILGLGLSLAPIGAYLSVTSHFDILPVLFSILVLMWVSGFDIIYALQDFTFDNQTDLLSIPVITGKKTALKISVMLHIVASSIVIIIGLHGLFNYLYFIGAGIFILLLFYQHTLVEHNDLSKVNLAFFTTNGIASIILAFFTILDLFLL